MTRGLAMSRKREKPLIEIARLAELVSYDPDTGLFKWKKRAQGRNNYAFNSKNKKGYMRGMVEGCAVLAHRAAWALYWGYWPENDIDHENHNRADNRMVNLRPATHVENQRNRALSPKNTSGATGVYWESRDKKWVVQVNINGSKHHGGYFDSIEDAEHAARTIYKALGFHPNHGL